jgi:hypothetical protein
MIIKLLRYAFEIVTFVSAGCFRNLEGLNILKVKQLSNVEITIDIHPNMLCIFLVLVPVVGPKDLN